jgi:hypothetical protein
MRRLTWLKTGVLILGVGAAVLVPVAVYRGRYYRSLGEFYSLLTVGRASLLYQAECGAPPGTLTDLLRTGCLRRSANGEWVDTRMGANGWRTPYADATRAKLLTPTGPDAYEWRDGSLVEKSTGKPFALVDTDDTAAWREHVEMANKALAKDWLKVMHGEPLPDW